MKRINLVVMVALATVMFLSSCSSGNDGVLPPQQPDPPPPLVWDQANWDEVLWQ